jgi:hypothetical protein
MLTSTILFMAAAAAQAPSTQATDGDKIVCKAERSVGTNLSSRVCKSKAKWAEERARSREDIQDDVNARAGAQKSEGWYMNAQSPGTPSTTGPSIKNN